MLRKTTLFIIAFLTTKLLFGTNVLPPVPKIKTVNDKIYWQITIVNECIVERHFENAQKIIQKVLENHPDNPLLTYYMYRILKLRGIDYQAQKYYKKTNILINRRKSLYALLAKVYIRHPKGFEIEKLRKQIESAITKHKNDYRVYIAGGHFYMSYNNLPEAIKMFNKAVSISPWLAQVHNLLGYLYTYVGEYKKAVNHLEDYAKLFPHLANPHDSLGEIYLLTGHYNKAIIEFKRALKISPTFLYAREHLIKAYEATGQYKKAIHEGLILWEQSDSDDRSAFALSTLGEICMLNGDYSRAETKIDTALKTRPEWPYYYYQKALLFLYEGKLDKARETISQLKNAIDGRVLSGKPDMKKEYLRKYDFIVAKYNVALGNFDTAISILTKLKSSITIPQKSINILEELAEALFASGKFSQSQNLVQQILKINPNHAPTLLLSAKINMTLSNKELAIKNIARCLSVLAKSDKSAPILKEALAISRQLNK